MNPRTLCMCSNSRQTPSSTPQILLVFLTLALHFTGIIASPAHNARGVLAIISNLFAPCSWQSTLNSCMHSQSSTLSPPSSDTPVPLPTSHITSATMQTILAPTIAVERLELRALQHIADHGAVQPDILAAQIIAWSSTTDAVQSGTVQTTLAPTIAVNRLELRAPQQIVGVGGGAVPGAAQPAAGALANGVTSVTKITVVGGVTKTTVVPFTIQPVTAGQGAAPTVQVGSIGLGTLTGQIGVVKSGTAKNDGGSLTAQRSWQLVGQGSSLWIALCACIGAGWFGYQGI